MKQYLMHNYIVQERLSWENLKLAITYGNYGNDDGSKR